METQVGAPGAPDMAAATAMGVGMLVFMVFVILISLVLTLIIWWKIFSKAGWPGALSLLLLVPVVNIIIPFYVAFATWPIQRELEALKRGKQ
jgi:heme/copper-type cytochrome/quinol oxidase subunit 2